MSDKNEKEKIATSMETNLEVFPYIDDLLIDLWDLGSFPRLYLEWFDELNIQPGIKVLDLGCGKGAVAIQIAEKFKVKMTGIDLHEPFLQFAEQKAKQFGVTHLCEFRKADITKAVSQLKDFDITFLNSIGAIWNNDIADTIWNLRNTVKTGGYIIYDDGYVKDGETVGESHYAYMTDKKSTLNMLTRFGDRIIKEKIFSREEIKKQNQTYLAAIEKRGKEIIDQNPDVSRQINDYIEIQRKESATLENKIINATWLIQKAG